MSCQIWWKLFEIWWKLFEIMWWRYSYSVLIRENDTHTRDVQEWIMAVDAHMTREQISCTFLISVFDIYRKRQAAEMLQI